MRLVRREQFGAAARRRGPGRSDGVGHGAERSSAFRAAGPRGPRGAQRAPLLPLPAGPLLASHLPARHRAGGGLPPGGGGAPAPPAAGGGAMNPSARGSVAVESLADRAVRVPSGERRRPPLRADLPVRSILPVITR